VKQLLSTPDLEAPEGSSPEQMLKVTEAFWKAMKDPKIASKPGPIIVTESAEHLLHDGQSVDFDVCVAGGTLGVFLALALQRRGHRVCIVERRLLQGRAQEWNISNNELESLVEAGLLTHEELQGCIDTAWEADRVGFYSGGGGGSGDGNGENSSTNDSTSSAASTNRKNDNDIWVKDVLNIGVSPRKLIALFKQKFLEAGGVLREHTVFKSAIVYQDCALVKVLPCGGSGSGGNGAGKKMAKEMELTPADVNRPCAVTSSSSPTSSSSNRNISSSGGSRTTSTNNSTTNTNSTNSTELRCRILIDCMGHYSSIVKQVRNGQQPDGMVVVVGGCFAPKTTTSDGNGNGNGNGNNSINTAANITFSNNTADLLYTFTDSFNDSQLFWEAFPAEGGAARTAYMFLYSDTHPDRPSFTSLLNTYLELLPQYQGISLDDITFKRVLFGGFPCYMRDSPLKPAFDRVLQVGDAAATQSPLSFGGFGAMVRHLPRLTRGIDQALTENKLSKGHLGWLQPYQPSLSVAWLFQRSMSLRVGQLRREEKIEESNSTSTYVNNKNGTSLMPVLVKKKTIRGWLPANHINRLLGCNFSVMRVFGDRVLRPFLQDSLQAGPLALTMLGMMMRDPLTVTLVLFQTGPMLILGWFRHFFSLLVASALFIVLKPLKAVVKNYTFQRFLDALEYGTASDYEYRATSPVTEEDIAGKYKLKEKVVNSSGGGGSSIGGGDGEKAGEVEQHPWPAAVAS
jgi:lycopene cyclase CruP